MVACTQTQPSEDSTSLDGGENMEEVKQDSLSFLALGDSYTIGESVSETLRWPVQLQAMLIDSLDIKLKDPRIIARTGWTTDELQQAINDADIKGQTFDLVGLLIGVNNQYRGYNVDQYRVEFLNLLDQAIGFSGGDTTRVFVISIPDYGVTPFAQNRDKEKIAKEIDLYNTIAKEFAEKRGVTYFDITPISREAVEDPTLIAGDGLHPSGKMYAEWVKLIFPWSSNILDQ